MLEYFTLILACQLVGEFAVSTIDLPFPGPVVGMVLLLVILVIRGAVPEPLAQVSSTLLSNLSLLFVPAGVGVMAHFDLLGADLWPLSIALIVSTLLTIAITGLTMAWLSRRAAANGGTKEGEV